VCLVDSAGLLDSAVALIVAPAELTEARFALLHHLEPGSAHASVRSAVAVLAEKGLADCGCLLVTAHAAWGCDEQGSTVGWNRGLAEIAAVALVAVEPAVVPRAVVPVVALAAVPVPGPAVAVDVAQLAACASVEVA